MKQDVEQAPAQPSHAATMASDAALCAALAAQLKGERRRAQALETQLLALRSQVAALEQRTSDEYKKSDAEAAQAVKLLRDMARVNQFSIVRTIVNKEEGIVGTLRIPVNWSKITAHSVVHVSACEAAAVPGQSDAGDYVGICGDAEVKVLSVACQTGLALVKVNVQWAGPLSLMVNVTLLGEPEQIIFSEPFDALRPFLPKEIVTLRDELLFNTTGFADGSDEDFLSEAYVRYLNREIDAKTKTQLKNYMNLAGANRHDIVKLLLKSK